MRDVRFATVVELRSLLRRRRISALELFNLTCDLLDREGRLLNAVAAVTRERGGLEAAAADRALARGKSGPLLGIPYGAKDLLDARGAPTTWGVAAYRDRIAERDATVVARLRLAGAPLAAKLALIGLAGSGGYRLPAASLQGPARNPWDPTRWTGGSSSGSAAAVAAGLIPFALGSETSGSIGGPATHCGITGLRPTYGLVSRAGAMPASWTLDKIGPLAHTADDCAAVLEVIAGRDRADRSTISRRFHPLDRRAAAAAVRSVRIGFAEEDLSGSADTARDALARGVAEMRRIAPRFRRAALPPDLPYGAMVTTVMSAEASEIFDELVEGPGIEELVDPRQRAGLRAGRTVLARDYLRAMRLRTVLGDAFRAIFREVDLLLSISRPSTASRLDTPLDAPRSQPVGNQAITAAANLAGLPAIFVPCGAAADGLPVGLQLVGPPWSEPLLVAVAARYQRDTAHHLRRPPL